MKKLEIYLPVLLFALLSSSIPVLGSATQSFRPQVDTLGVPDADASAFQNVRTDTVRVQTSTNTSDWRGMSLRTNLLWDGVAEPNLSLEFEVGDHVSIGVSGGLKPWPRWLAWDWDNVNNPQHWRNYTVVPQIRLWPRRVFDGWFFGADFVYTHFNVSNIQFPFGLYPDVQNHRLQGSFWGGGLTIGRSWWMGEHWRIELEAGAAAGLAAYSRYECAHCGTRLSDERQIAVVPKLGLNIAYNTLARSKRVRKGSVTTTVTETRTYMTPPVAFVVQLSDAIAPPTVGDSLAVRNSWVIPVERYRPLDYRTRPGRDSILCVQFLTSSDSLDRDYKRNGAALDAMTDAIKAIQADPRTDELLVSIVGLSSIEGPEPLNDSISVCRALSVANYLKEHAGLEDRCIETFGKGEAWDWFYEQLSAAPKGLSKAQVRRLLEIIESTPDLDRREQLIREDGALWREVISELLADQRTAGYIRVYYGTTADPATERLNGEIYELIKAKRYREAVQAIREDAVLMSRIHTNAEAANALGIAAYFTALDDKDTEAEEEAIALIRHAAMIGSAAAKTNLEGIKTYGPARKKYELWQAINNQTNNKQ